MKVKSWQSEFGLATSHFAFKVQTKMYRFTFAIQHIYFFKGKNLVTKNRGNDTTKEIGNKMRRRYKCKTSLSRPTLGVPHFRQKGSQKETTGSPNSTEENTKSCDKSKHKLAYRSETTALAMDA